MPANSKPNLITSHDAVGAVAQFAAVAPDGSQAAAGGMAIGFAQTSAPAGKRVAVAVDGSSLAVCSGTIARFDGVEVGAGGTVVKLSSGYRVGTALNAGVAGDYIEVLVQPAVDGLNAAQVAGAAALVSEAGITTWANRASVLTAGLSQAFFTDLGPYGSDWLYTGGRWRPRSGRVVLKNLVTSVSNSAAPKVVMDYATVFAGLLLDGDALEIEFQKTREGGTSDTDTTDVMIGSAALTLGTSTGLSTGALATTTIQLAPHYEIVRLSATSVRTSTLPGGVGFGSASSLPTTTTGLPNMDTLDTYLQVTSDLTTAGGEVAWLRKFRVTLVAGS